MIAPLVRLQGSRTDRSAFSAINRRWHDLLGRRGDIRLTDDPNADVDVTIHHDFSTRFGDVQPKGRRRVAVRPWDFGPYPRRWVQVVEAQYDELWVHSRWIERNAMAGGLQPARVHRVPLGVDPAIMRAEGPRADPGVGSAFVFLFVGAAVRRKGIDLLVEAYRRAFGPRDPVALVVKDHTRDVFYRDQSYADDVQRAAADPAVARVVYLDEYMPADDLAALVRRADAFVLPYRCEGFACPVLEAMACGTPPIIPAFGACLDYCDASTGVLVPTREIQFPVGRAMRTNSLGFEEEVDRVHFCETPIDRLADALRAAVAMQAEARAALRRAAATRVNSWTWSASADAIVHRVLEIA